MLRLFGCGKNRNRRPSNTDSLLENAVSHYNSVENKEEKANIKPIEEIQKLLENLPLKRKKMRCKGAACSGISALSFGSLEVVTHLVDLNEFIAMALLVPGWASFVGIFAGLVVYCLPDDPKVVKLIEELKHHPDYNIFCAVNDVLITLPRPLNAMIVDYVGGSESSDVAISIRPY